MGGYGSGRRGWASTKETVESCLVLSAAWLQSEGRIQAGIGELSGMAYPFQPCDCMRPHFDKQ